MTNPKVSEKEMLEHLRDFMDCVHPFRKGGYCPECQAIRAAIEEGGKLREQIEKMQKRIEFTLSEHLGVIVDTPGSMPEIVSMIELLGELRDLKLNGEEK
jgi:hypothetical protein